MINNLTLQEIWIYPVKSLGGIALSSSLVQEKGLQYDRRYMLVDQAGETLTQRKFPQLALFRLSREADSFHVRHDAGKSLKIPVAPAPAGDERRCTVWNDVVSVVELSESHSAWFSELLGLSCRLVFFPEDNARPVDASYALNHENVSLADAFPVLLIGQSSLDDLNGRLASPVPMDRFRPNLVVKGATPFAEDHWRHFTIGNNEFAAVKPCARCVLTTVDQKTGIKGAEPLATLARYRATDNKVYFGQNVIVVSATQIKTGDPVSVLSYR